MTARYKVTDEMVEVALKTFVLNMYDINEETPEWNEITIGEKEDLMKAMRSALEALAKHIQEATNG